MPTLLVTDSIYLIHGLFFGSEIIARILYFLFHVSTMMVTTTTPLLDSPISRVCQRRASVVAAFALLRRSLLALCAVRGYLRSSPHLPGGGDCLKTGQLRSIL
jgi:hypothetical protein